MRNLPISALTVLIIVLLSHCGPRKKTVSQRETLTKEEAKPVIELTPMPESPKYLDAMLELNAPLDQAELNPGTISFDFEVTNYRLATQTEGAISKNIANSKKGQHIHLILNNDPYSAHYEPVFEKELESGHYVALAFLSRSYHESVKNPSAYVLKQFHVGEKDENDLMDLDASHIFYSRPKGKYAGIDTMSILLDFYLVNTELSEGGNTVIATVNGEEFVIDTWQPYLIEGMSLGKNTVKLELLNSTGALIPSPFNPVERTIILEK